jgi:hypothetical protein
MGPDGVQALDRAVTFIPERKSPKQRRLEKKAEIVTMSLRSSPRQIDDLNTRLRIDRGVDSHRFNQYWKVQLLDSGGAPRMFGTVVDVKSDHSFLEFRVPISELTRQTQIRIIPY